MNQLQFETSPYLLQHRNNPVDWHPWGDAALQKARAEQKLLLISVGYAACHWCHVMEHESFEDEAVASVMNAHYVPIKVDREERPDIDQVYMNAAMILTGHGGWPLNVIALPDGKPVFAGTYFPKMNWIKVLNYFAEMYHKEPERMREQAERITEGLQQVEHIPLMQSERLIDSSIPDQLWQTWKTAIDFEWGGRKGAPKFMMPNNYEYLLRYFFRTKDAAAGDAIKITLKKMAFGGLYDVLAGGFARYSVDAYWKVPHFEKMLYDNGQLMSLYAQAYQLTKRPLYQSVVRQTADWLETEMLAPEGGFYASLDADSEGVEGKYYCWTEDELRGIIPLIDQTIHEDLPHLLPEKFDTYAFLEELYNLSEEGNFEHGMNALFRTQDHEYFMEKYGWSKELFQQLLRIIHKVLYAKRQKKIRPGTDDKILTEWNAIAIKGLCDAYKAFGEARYLDMATRATHFLLTKCKKADHRLDRNYKNGKSNINAFLPDYAFLIDALIALHQVSADTHYLEEAAQLCTYTIQHFYNAANGMFYITSDIDAALITRSLDSSDNVIPSANSMMAKNLLQLSKLLDLPEYEQMSLTMLNNVLDDVKKNPAFYSNWAIVLDMHLHLDRELAVTGTQAKEALQMIQAHFLPDILVTASTEASALPLLKERFVKDKTLLYLCQNKSCELPEENVEILLKRII